jgi:hypothetical protein
MPPKTASAARRSAAPAKKKKGAVEIIVRRGALRRFDALKTKTGELPVLLTWDRRLDDRRDRGTAAAAAKSERSYKDRRRTPPFTWELADFVVVEPTKRQKKARKKTSKKS